MSFRFAHPFVLLLLFLPVIILFVRYFNVRRLDAPSMLYSDTSLVENLSVTWRVRLRRLPDILRLLAWIVLVIALARPQSGRSQQVIRGQGIDIVLALDISGSMEALDFEPDNRLEAAKAVISDFIKAREFDRVGLVVFARDAFQHVPPTLDDTVLLRSLGEIQLATQLGLADGTAIGSGLASAANMLRSSTAASKVAILLTDGANNAGALDPVTAAQAVTAFGIRVYTIGMGKPGLVSIPAAAGGTALVESDLDEPTLRAIAETTGAQYFRAEDLRDLQQVYGQIDTLERSDVERQVLVRWRDRAGALIIAGIGLLLAERALRRTVFQTVP